MTRHSTFPTGRPRAIVMMVSLLGPAACGSDGAPPVMTARVEVVPSEASLIEGETRDLEALLFDEEGDPLEGREVSWRVAGLPVVTVDDDGTVVALSEGSTLVEARSDGILGLAAIEVRAPPVIRECDEPDPSWIWCDDFEDDRWASYFEVNDDGGGMARAAGVGNEGSWGLRVLWDPGEVFAGDLKVAFGRTPSEYFRQVDDGTEDYHEIYVRVYLRHQEGWEGGGADKLLRLSVFAHRSWAQAGIGHVWSGGPTDSHLVLDPATGVNEAGVLRTDGWNQWWVFRWLGLKPGETPIFDAEHVGRWYCVETRMRLNDPGLSNGVFALWIDGDLEASSDDLNWHGPWNEWGINAVFLENYWNAGSPVAQERYLDRFVVGTERIGC